MSATTDLRLLLATDGGMIRRAEHPQLRTAIDWMLRSRQLEQPLPGVLAAPGLPRDLAHRVHAGQLWRPDAVIVGPAAACLGLGIERRVDAIDLALPRGGRSRPGYRVHQSFVPPEHRIQHGRIQFSSPTWTAAHLAGHDNGRTIDDALRLGLTSPRELEAALALMSGSQGQCVRRFVVENSRSEPWSQAERRFHDLLREHRIGRWHANRWMEIDQMRFPVDVLFDDIPLAVEVMSWAFHGNRETFHRDSLKIAALAAHVWVYLPVTWPMFDDPSRLLGTVVSAMEQARGVVERDPARARLARSVVARTDDPA